MINGFLQVGIVVLVVGVLLCLIGFLRKNLNLNRILVALCVFFLGAGCLYLGFDVPEEGITEYVSGEQGPADRYFAALYAEQGELARARKLLGTPQGLEEDSELLLLSARLSVLDQCYSQAKLFYGEYLELEGNVREASEEAEYLWEYMGQGITADNGVIAEYLAENHLSAADLGIASSVNTGKEPAFQNQEEFHQAVLERLVKAALEEVEDSDDSREIKKAGENIKGVYECLRSYQGGESYDEEALAGYAQNLNKILKGKDSLQSNVAVREAALVANALLGNSSDVASNINEYAGISELAVATDLLVSGYVEEKAFKQLIGDRPKKTDIALVCNRCKEIVKENKGQLSSAEYRSYDNAIEVMESSDKNYILKNILILMDNQAAVQAPGDRSKLYLEIAKGFDYAGMEQMVSDYIDLALENAGSSDDSEYAQAMVGLLEYISGESYDSAREVPGYVRDALSRLMPVPMEFFEKKKQGEDTVAGNAKDQEQPVAFAMGQPVAFGEPSEKEETEALEDFDFAASLTEKITQKKSVINIGQIELENFPIVTTRLSFGKGIDVDQSNLKDRIRLYDCGYPIQNMEVNKISNLTGKIILLCDLSGSMGGNEGNLRDAVKSFADGMSDSEKVAVIGFSDRIVFQSDFLDDPDAVKEYADKIYASGGTCVYPTILAAADMFSDDVNDNNIIVVMTDGRDGARPSDSELATKIKEIAAQHNCTIYTVGIGGADDGYLTTIAELGNGQYLFADDPESLASFYEFMHAQIGNSYVVTYMARDTVKNERLLEVESKDSTGSAAKKYYLNEEAANDHDSYAEELFDVKNADGLQVYGLDTTFMYASKTDVTRTLFGENFEEGKKYEITLKGRVRSYPLTWTYTSSTQLEVVLPYSLAVGTYSLELSTDEEVCEVKDALVVAAPGSLRQFKFGSYVFTCESATETDRGMILHDNVILNGWLHFKGDLMFSGDTRDAVSQYVSMTDSYGSYVKYSRYGSQGLAKTLAKWGVPVYLPSLGTLELYSETYDSSSYQDFPVQKFVLNAPIPVRGVAHVGGTVSLYPDMLYSQAFYSEADLKFLNNILKNLPQNLFNPNAKDSLFTQKATGSLAITNTCFLLNASYEVEYDGDRDTSKKFQIGSMGLCIKKFGFDLDSVKEEYSIEANVGFEAFSLPKIGGKVEGLGLKLAWNGEGLDSVELSAEGKKMLTQTPIPLYIVNVSVGAENLSQIREVKDILAVKVTGGFKLQSDDIIKHVPKKVKEFFHMDNLYLAELDDAKISVCLADFNLGFEAKLKLLGIQLAKSSIELGKINYQNRILGIEETEYGADVKLNVGIDQKWKNLDVILDGEGRVTLGYPFGGLTLMGEIGYDLRWFIFHGGKDLYGDFGIGCYWNHNNELQFIVKAYGQTDKGKTCGFRVDVSPSMGTKKVKY